MYFFVVSSRHLDVSLSLCLTLVNACFYFEWRLGFSLRVFASGFHKLAFAFVFWGAGTLDRQGKVTPLRSLPGREGDGGWVVVDGRGAAEAAGSLRSWEFLPAIK